MPVTIREKQKINKTNIDSAFLKSKTIWKELILEQIMPQRPKSESDNQAGLWVGSRNIPPVRPFSLGKGCIAANYKWQMLL